MIKKGNLYYPTKQFQKKAWINDPKIYKQAKKDPVKFWEKLARELFWFKKWRKGFSLALVEHKPPRFEWFGGGKINITANIFEKDWQVKKNKIALIWEPEPIEERPRILTYRALFSEVCRCANYLKKLGVKKGDRVGIYLPMIPETIITMLACARIGAVHSVVFSAFSPSALRIRLQDTQSKVLITANKYYRRGKLIDLKKNAKEGIKDTKVKEMVLVERSGKTPWQKENDFCKPRVMDSEDIQFIAYESGSMGKPIGTVHACGGYTVQTYWTGKWVFDFHPDDVFWSTSDLGWIAGHTYTCYSPLLNGITTLIFEGAPDWPEANRWAQIIEKHDVTIFYTAPTAIRMFKKYGKDVLKKYKFKNLRLLGSVGEPIDESAWLWYFKNVGKRRCPIVDTWWQTETGGILITSLPGIGPFKPAFTGLPFPGIKADILDEKGNSCPPKKEGNLVILQPFSPALLRGIYKDPQKYFKTYWSKYGNKIYFTEDAALKDKNNLIRIIGRTDDVIKVAGHRLTTGELENAINLCPEIIESAVVGKPDEIKGEVPVVFAVRAKPLIKENKEKLKKEIMEQVNKKIGPIALPKEVYLVEDLPKTQSGKIMRRILKSLFTREGLGDLSTLANPESVDKIKKIIK